MHASSGEGAFSRAQFWGNQCAILPACVTTLKTPPGHREQRERHRGARITTTCQESHLNVVFSGQRRHLGPFLRFARRRHRHLKVEFLLKTDSGYPKGEKKRKAEIPRTKMHLGNHGNVLRYNTPRSALPVSALAHSGGPGARQADGLQPRSCRVPLAISRDPYWFSLKTPFPPNLSAFCLLYSPLLFSSLLWLNPICARILFWLNPICIRGNQKNQEPAQSNCWHNYGRSSELQSEFRKQKRSTFQRRFFPAHLHASQSGETCFANREQHEDKNEIGLLNKKHHNARTLPGRGNWPFYLSRWQVQSM